MERVFHGIEMVEVAPEFIEAVNGRQILIAIAKMVLAELSGLVAHPLQRSSNRHGLGGNAEWCSRLAYRCHAGANGQFARDEVGAACRTTRLGVVGIETHSFSSKLVEVGSESRHHALVIDANVEPANVVTHDDDDVGLFSLRRCE